MKRMARIIEYIRTKQLGTRPLVSYGAVWNMKANQGPNLRHTQNILT